MPEDLTLITLRNGKSQTIIPRQDLGAGWGYPVRIENEGVKSALQFEHLKQSITLILLTPKGSRLMRPWFGSNLFRYVDSPITRRTVGLMRYEIYEALKEETRGKVTKIEISNPQPHTLSIVITMLIENDVSVAVKLAYDRDSQRWEGLQ